jgi:predicted dehydrogenase/nucleoside-diphosphate-sugar epimerase
MIAPALERLRLLVLGGGAVVAEYYLAAFQGLGWQDGVWVSDPSPASLARLTAQWPHLKTLQLDFESAIDRAPSLGVQAIVVALPNALHEPAVSLALDRGFDVLCEKPLALTRAACERLTCQAERTGRVLAVGMTRRYLPAVGALKRVIAAGWLGDIEAVEGEDGHDFAWSSESGIYAQAKNAGVLANVGIHTIDLVQHLCGPLTPRRYADDWRGGVEANATFELETAGGAPVQLKFSNTRALAKGLTIRGRRGEVTLTADLQRARYRTADGEVLADVSLATAYRYGRWPHRYESAFRDEFCDFASAVVHRHAELATAREAAATAALIDWAYTHHISESRTAPSSARSSAADLRAGRIMITGGAGFVGGHLIEALVESGFDDVIVPVRSFHRSANAWRFPVRVERGNVLDRSRMRELMQGCRYVFHLAYGRDGANPERVTIEGTQNVVEAGIDAGVECIVVLSTTSIFGDPGGAEPADETSAYAPPQRPYEIGKTAAERWTLERAASETRTRIVVLSPSNVYGPQGTAFTELPARLLQDGHFCWIEGGCGVANYVHVRNLIDAVLIAAGRPEAHGHRFIISDGWTTWRSFYTELFGDAVAQLPSYSRADLIAFGRKVTPSLRDVARSVVGNGELWRLVREHPRLSRTKAMFERVTPRLYRRVKDSRRRSEGQQSPDTGRPSVPPLFLDDLFGVTHTRFSSEKARRMLGWRPMVDLSTGQAESRAWLVDVGLFG